jgi:glycosyltransferase involved in cell wall biosynthesis
MKHPASIGIVMHDFPLGGTERIALRLARAWLGRGVAVTIFCGDESGPLRAMVPEGAHLAPAKPRISRGPRSRQRLGRAAARYFAAHPVDALFVTGNFHWEVVPALSRIAPRPILLVQISSPLEMPQRRRFRQALFRRRMRRLLARADALVAMDEAGRRSADAMMKRPIATTVPLPALDDGDLPVVPASGRMIFAAGRLIHQKGFDLLIEAFRQLDDPEARLVIAGSGPEEEALRQQIVTAGLTDRVRMAGYTPDIRPFLDQARLFVLPSRFEGYGAVIIEALGAGRPVIATASTPAVDDVLTDPVCGRAIPIEDIPALTRALRELLDQPPPDPFALAQTVAAYRIGAGAVAYLDLFARTRS